MAATKHDLNDVRRFYEMICFTRSLSPVRGSRIKPVSSAESDGSGVAKCRRDFADAIAYFCAYDGDPDSVTAVALGRRDTKIVLWVASNAKVSEKVIDFLNNDVLAVVQRLACANMKQEQLPSTEQEVVPRLLERALHFTRKKIFKYYKLAIAAGKRIWGESLNPEGLEHTNTKAVMFCKWFKAVLYKNGGMLEERDMPSLAINCYVARTAKTFDILRHGSSQGNEHRLDYEQLYKLLNKLGKHIALFKKMICATVALREDFGKGFVVEPITASTPKSIPLARKGRAMEKIVAWIFPKEDERMQFYHHLDRFYNVEEISQSLQSCMEKGRVRVHAEILLIDYFDKFDADFLDNSDKYIGCSKPACYLCYQYISQHPGNYTVPPTHQKLYYAWSVPK
ncbi:hypothetical protein BDV10DRAFT_180699 [Aspergillus recurvatus]